MTHPTEPSSEIALPVADVDTIDKPNPRAERLFKLNEEHGLTATSPEEINHMYLLLDPQFARGGARDYVGNIAGANAKRAHQEPIEAYEEMGRRIFHSLSQAYQLGMTFNDPILQAAAEAKGRTDGLVAAEQTVASFADKFLGYLDDAKQNINALSKFDKVLSSEDIKQDIKLGQVGIKRIMENDENAKRAIAAVTRYLEGFLFSHDAGEDYTKTDYMSDDVDVVAREIETVSDIDVAFLRKIISMVRELELARESLWREQLHGHSADRESGIAARYGLSSVNIDGLKDYIETAMLKIYRGAYNKIVETE